MDVAILPASPPRFFLHYGSINYFDLPCWLCIADMPDAMVQVECGVTAEWCIYPCATFMESGLSAELHQLYWN